MTRNVALLAALGFGFLSSNAQADIGSIGLEGFGTSINTPGLAAATTFTIPTMLTSDVGTGIFSTVPEFAVFSGGSFSFNSATGFSFSNATYGTFAETAAPMLSSTTTSNGVVTAENFYILGTYIGGPVGLTAVPSSFTVSFTQDGGPGTALSSSGTVTVPPSGAVPEPASAILLVVGLVVGGGYGLRCRMAR